jgi:hypothetical protein
VSASLLKQALQRHPAAPAPAGLALVVHRLPADDPARPLRLRFEVEGDPALVRWPAPLAEGEAPRRDGLWRHTCFEAFVGAAAGAGYVEYNFSPSGAWAAYRFDRYREGMRSEPVVAEPRILVSRTAVRTSIEVAASWPTGGAAPDPRTRAGRARLGLTAVIEAVDGGLSYWALGHPEGRPDFHNDAGFRLEVEVPG